MTPLLRLTATTLRPEEQQRATLYCSYTTTTATVKGRQCSSTSGFASPNLQNRSPRTLYSTLASNPSIFQAESHTGSWYGVPLSPTYLTRPVDAPVSGRLISTYERRKTVRYHIISTLISSNTATCTSYFDCSSIELASALTLTSFRLLFFQALGHHGP